MSDRPERPLVTLARIDYQKAKALSALRELSRMAAAAEADASPYLNALAILEAPSDVVGSRSVPVGDSTIAAIVEMMTAIGVSRTDLARRMGVVPPRVTQMLTGRKNITLSTLGRVAAALGVKAHVVLEAPRTGGARFAGPKRPKGVQ